LPRLSLSYYDVGAIAPRSLEDAEANRINSNYVDGLILVSYLSDGLDVLLGKAKVTGRLNVDRCGFLTCFCLRSSRSIMPVLGSWLILSTRIPVGCV
jgi:hypothetical protein